MQLHDLSESVLSKFAQSITDAVFQFIQNDKELMSEYLRSVEKNGLDATNRHLGKAIKTRFYLENDTQRMDATQSTLIKSHQIFL